LNFHAIAFSNNQRLRPVPRMAGSANKPDPFAPEMDLSGCIWQLSSQSWFTFFHYYFNELFYPNSGQ